MSMSRSSCKWRKAHVGGHRAYCPDGRTTVLLSKTKATGAYRCVVRPSMVSPQSKPAAVATIGKTSLVKAKAICGAVAYEVGKQMRERAGVRHRS